MSHTADLLLFAALVFGIIVLPGLDMAFVMGSSLTAGRRHGMAAVAGVVAGAACHVAMTTLGIGVLLKVMPVAFNALLLAGALYIAWIGISLLRADSAFGIQTQGGAASAWVTFRRGALTCLMNPKACLFMLAVSAIPARGVRTAMVAIAGAVADHRDHPAGGLRRPCARRRAGTRLAGAAA